LDLLRPKRETALFFKTVDDWITNFDYEISEHISVYYNGELSPAELSNIHNLTLIGPQYLRTEAKGWQVGYSSSAKHQITANAPVNEEEPPLLQRISND
jgi:hypothetical protein